MEGEKGGDEGMYEGKKMRELEIGERIEKKEEI